MSDVVILGCPRSGTSILLELFELAGFDPHFEPSMEMLRLAPHDRRWVVKNPAEFARGDQDAALVARTPGLACNLGDLEELLEEPTYIWIVRHPLDVVASLTPGLTGGWNHGPVIPEYKGVDEPRERAIRMWLWLNATGGSEVRAWCDPLVVRYEDLVKGPEGQARRILSHVNALDEMAVAQYAAMVTDDPQGHQAKYQDRWAQNGHRTHVGRWRWAFSESEADEIWTRVEPVAWQFGYGRRS